MRAMIKGIGLVMVMAGLGCGSDDGGDGSGGGSCVLKSGSCYEVTDPADYSIDEECTILGNEVEDSACDPTKFARKCTQVTQVSEGDGPETDVTYVYYFTEDDDTACAGTEEEL